jgi:hypothetical protein
MKKLTTRMSGSRFDRYYSEVVKSGTGYPTADEARRDLQRLDLLTQNYGWIR